MSKLKMKTSLVSWLFFTVAGVVIPPSVLQQAEREGSANFFLQLKPANFNQKVGDIHEILNQHATQTQKGLLTNLELLKSKGLVTRYQSYSISNTVAVVGTKQALETLANQPEVLEVTSNSVFRQALPITVKQLAGWDGKQAHWSLVYINATNIPTEIIERSKKLVYANADTGVDYTHEALVTNYIGNLGNNQFDHNYAWWDGVKKAANTPLETTRYCGVNIQKPCDDSNHGSHTMSSTVGGNNLGVSPASKWIACRNMNQGLGTPESYLGCLQFLIAPTDLNGNNPKPELRPHAIGNSYGCPPEEGCSRTTFQAAVKALKAAGIFMSVSAGNEGSTGCSSIDTPPAIDIDSFTVASSAYKSNARSSFSSMGPVPERTIALDVTAPGSSITGAVPGNKYAVMSGTSMASPHVSGAALLVMAACPHLERQVDKVADVLRYSATPLFSNRGCGNDNSTHIPNNEFGYGLINVAKAIALCKYQQA